MSDTFTNRLPDPKGVQAYRWIMLISMGILGALSLRVLSQIDDTAKKVEDLRLQASDMRGTINSRIDAHVERLNSIDRRNDQQDVKIDDLQRLVWRHPDPPTPQPPQPQPRPPNMPFPAPGPALVPDPPSIRVYPP